MMTTDQHSPLWTLSKSTALADTPDISRGSKREPGQPCPRSIGKPACPGCACTQVMDFLDQDLS